MERRLRVLTGRTVKPRCKKGMDTGKGGISGIAGALPHRLWMPRVQVSRGAPSGARGAGKIPASTFRKHQNASKRDAFLEVTLNFPHAIYKVHHWKSIRHFMVIKLQLLGLHLPAHRNGLESRRRGREPRLRAAGSP